MFLRCCESGELPAGRRKKPRDRSSSSPRRSSPEPRHGRTSSSPEPRHGRTRRDDDGRSPSDVSDSNDEARRRSRRRRREELATSRASSSEDDLKAKKTKAKKKSKASSSSSSEGSQSDEGEDSGSLLSPRLRSALKAWARSESVKRGGEGVLAVLRSVDPEGAGACSLEDLLGLLKTHLEPEGRRPIERPRL